MSSHHHVFPPTSVPIYSIFSLIWINSLYSYCRPITCVLDSIWSHPLKDIISVILLSLVSALHVLLDHSSCVSYYSVSNQKLSLDSIFPFQPLCYFSLFLYSQTPWKNYLYSSFPIRLLLLSFKSTPIASHLCYLLETTLVKANKTFILINFWSSFTSQSKPTETFSDFYD